ncbi:DUF4173 domain-containing protein [Peptostreptococcaceae bacterium AGR-M142]
MDNTNNFNFSIKDKKKTIIISLILSIIFRYFFLNNYLGISMPIFIGIIIFSIHNIFPKFYANLKNNLDHLIFLIPIIALSLTFAIYNNEYLKFYNIIILIFLIYSYFLFIKNKSNKLNIEFFVDLGEKFLESIFLGFIYIFPFLKEISKSINRPKKELSSTKKQIFIGILISIPILFILISLLASADSIFLYYTKEFFNLFSNLNININFPTETLFVIVIFFLLIFGFILSLDIKDQSTGYKIEEKEKLTQLKKLEFKIPSITSSTILISINIVYLIFTIVQFSYLYAGNTNLPNNMNFSEYARRGFFELVFLTIINQIILSFCMKYSDKSNKKISTLLNYLYSILILLTFNMLFSAAYKMNLYQNAYGFTRLRIGVFAFIILFALILSINFVAIWRRNIPVVKLVLISTLLVYTSFNYVNVDKIIAKNNIEVYKKTNIIDINYLKKLSIDCHLELYKLTKTKNSSINNNITVHLEAQKKKTEKKYDSWFEFNYYKSKLIKLNI